MNKKLIILAAIIVPLLTFTVVSANSYDHQDKGHHKPHICKQHEHHNDEDDEDKISALSDNIEHKKHCKKEEPTPCEFNPELNKDDEECKPPEEETPTQPETPASPPEQPSQPSQTPEVPKTTTPSAPAETQAEAFVDFQGK